MGHPTRQLTTNDKSTRLYKLNNDRFKTNKMIKFAQRF